MTRPKKKLNVNLDALSLTFTRIKQNGVIVQRFEELSSLAEKKTGIKAFAASRYRRSIKLPLHFDLYGYPELDGPTLLLQCDPFNERDSFFRCDFKSLPYQTKHFRKVSLILNYLLGDQEEFAPDKTLVTRLDIACDVEEKIESTWLLRDRTRFFTQIFGRGGKLVCYRVGKSSSKLYVCVYNKEYRNSRHSTSKNKDFLRIETRARPRCVVSSLATNSDILSHFDNLIVLDEVAVESSAIFDAETFALVRHFGFIPIFMSYPHNTRKKLRPRLKLIGRRLVEDVILEKFLDDVQSNLLLMFELECTDVESIF